MTSKILSNMGLGNLDLAIPFIVLMIIAVILCVLVIILMSKFHKLEKKYNKFMQGKTAGSLEEEISALFEDVRFLKNYSDKNKKDIHHLYKLQEKNIQKVGIKKYDAFQQMGGQLSYCLAFLDENNNGIIMNSVHSTEGCYSYVKEIKQGNCSLPLGEEEMETLEMALGENN